MILYTVFRQEIGWYSETLEAPGNLGIRDMFVLKAYLRNRTCGVPSNDLLI